MSEANPNLEYITKFAATREKHPKAAQFALQAVARELLGDSRPRELLGDSRLKICYRYHVPDRNVEIWHSGKRQAAYYTGLMKCGLQWICPLCSSRLSEKRREIVRAALDNSRDRFVPVMVSYTVQHNAGDRLAALLDGMLAAYRWMRKNRGWRDLKEEYMIRGEVRAVEITHGSNGWHPHFHTVMFLDIAILPYIKEGDTYKLEEFLYEPLRTHVTREWLVALGKHDLAAQQGPAIHVRGDWASLDEYLTKSGSTLPTLVERWGVAEELTKSHRKKAMNGGVNVWDMLLLHYAGERIYGSRFIEYYHATRGKSMLQWTPGFLAQLQIEAQSDDQLLESDPEPGDLFLLALTSDQWRIVLDAGAEGALLDAAAEGDYLKLEKFLASLEKVSITN